MEATYKKLQSGDWGLLVKGDKPAPGTKIVVAKRSGEKKEEKVGLVLWSGEGKHICTVDRSNGQRVQAGQTGQQPSDRLPFVLPDRTLVKQVPEGGVMSRLQLSAVEKRLEQMRKRQQPADIIRPLSDLFVGFPGHMEANWATPVPEAREGQTYLVTSNGASLLARNVLPSRFFPGLRQLAKMDSEGGRLATQVWQKFGAKCRKPRMVRTCRVKVNGAIRWVVRSCHSNRYAPYDNLELVTDIRKHAGDFASMPVLSWWVTDTGMRIRFYAVEDTLAAFMHLDDQALMNEPIPMIEVWNSEVGRRRVGMRAGLFRLVSGTGLCCWSDRTEFGWIHRGSSTRIADGVKGAFSSLFETAKEVIEVYKAAMDVDIDDPEAYLGAVLARKVPDKVLAQAKEALQDPTTTPGGSLASVVDAIALAAQRTLDLFTQEEIENLASQVMINGYYKAQKTRDGNLKASEA